MTQIDSGTVILVSVAASKKKSSKVDWAEMARIHRLRSDNDRPMASPRIATCRKCGSDAGAAGWLYCDTHHAEMADSELLAKGEHLGNWRIGRNRLGNPIWERDI